MVSSARAAVLRNPPPGALFLLRSGRRQAQLGDERPVVAPGHVHDGQ